MVLLRRVIGDALRARRQAQHRTLREVSTAANVSLGYLSEIERGQKEPSSELLSAVCEALGAQLSELLREVSHSVENAERGSAPVPVGAPATRPAPDDGDAAGTPAGRTPAPDSPTRTSATTPAMARSAANAASASATRQAPAAARAAAKAALARQPHAATTTTVDGDVAVTVRQDGPLRATLRATRTHRPSGRGRDALTPV